MQASLPRLQQTPLSLLQGQPAHYIVAQLHARKYLLTPNDILTVPRIPSLKLGDTIRLDRVSELGSRNYTIKPSSSSSGSQAQEAYLGSDTVEAHATVIEHCKSALVKTEKFKRRKRYHRTITSKPAFTKLKVLDFVIGGKLMGQSSVAQQFKSQQPQPQPQTQTQAAR